MTNYTWWYNGIKEVAMPEKPITEKVIAIIKDVDATIQEVEKGIHRLITGAKDLKQAFNDLKGNIDRDKPD
jgi:hypothetical protein